MKIEIPMIANFAPRCATSNGPNSYLRSHRYRGFRYNDFWLLSRYNYLDAPSTFYEL